MNVNFAGCCALMFSGKQAEQKPKAAHIQVQQERPKADINPRPVGDSVHFSGCCG